MISAKNIVACLGSVLSDAYGVPFVLDDSKPFGWGRTVVDEYSMTAHCVQVGCSSGAVSYACDVCSGVVAVFHEFRHVAQLMALHDDELRLSGMSYGATTSVCESFAATAPRLDYYEANYRSLPHELDAERYGTRLGSRWVASTFDDAFVFRGMKERLEHVSQDVYPINLKIARHCANVPVLLSLFDTRFSPSFLSFASSHLRDLVGMNIEAGLTSSIVGEKLSSRRSHVVLQGNSRIEDIEIAPFGSSRLVEDDYYP